jgi:hypothetical protein
MNLASTGSNSLPVFKCGHSLIFNMTGYSIFEQKIPEMKLIALQDKNLLLMGFNRSGARSLSFVLRASSYF